MERPHVYRDAILETVEQTVALTVYSEDAKRMAWT
jgi:hypothetical protein